MNKLVLFAALVALLALCSVPATAKTVEVPKPDGFVCDVCFFLVSWVEAKLASNKTESWIISEVDNLCSIAAPFLGPECKALVAYYVPQVITQIENNNPPGTICASLGLCSQMRKQRVDSINVATHKGTSVLPQATKEVQVIQEAMARREIARPPVAAPSADPYHLGCAQCMFMSTLTYGLTTGMNNPVLIAAKLTSSCVAIQNPPVALTCQRFVTRPGVIDMLAARTPPQRICARLSECQLAREMTAEENTLKKFSDYIVANPLPSLSMPDSAAALRTYGDSGPPGPSSTECQLCQWIFSAYESWLSDGQTEAEIALFLSQLCNFFGSYAPQCSQLVRVYVPKVIQNYVERTTPPILCTSIGFCNFPINQLRALH